MPRCARPRSASFWGGGDGGGGGGGGGSGCGGGGDDGGGGGGGCERDQRSTDGPATSMSSSEGSALTAATVPLTGSSCEEAVLPVLHHARPASSPKRPACRNQPGSGTSIICTTAFAAVRLAVVATSSTGTPGSHGLRPAARLETSPHRTTTRVCAWARRRGEHRRVVAPAWW